MLSQRAKYALRAMIRLAEYGEATPVSVTVLANDTQIPRAFLEQIFSELRRRNLVVALILGALVVLFYVMTLVRVHP